MTAPVDAAESSGPLLDDRGRVIRISASPKRIVSLAPHATESLALAGASERLVAVDPHSDWPPSVQDLPRVSAYPQIDLERLLALRPDLIVVWGEGLSRSTLSRMESLGLQVFVSEPSRLKDVADSLERIARVLEPGAGDHALSLSSGFAAARAFRSGLETIGSRYASREPLRVFVQLWDSPLVSTSDRSVMGEALRLCGAVNVLGDLPGAAPRVAPEAVVRARPQLILATRADASPERWRMAGLTGPGRESAFIAFDGRELERASPRMLDPLARLCEVIDAQRARITAPRS